MKPEQIPQPDLEVVRLLALHVNVEGGLDCVNCPNASFRDALANDPDEEHVHCAALDERVDEPMEDAPCQDYRETWFVRALIEVTA